MLLDVSGDSCIDDLKTALQAVALCEEAAAAEGEVLEKSGRTETE